MSTRALTLAVRLLTTACAGAALGTMTGCPFPFDCPEPWSEVQTMELGASADILDLTRASSYDALVTVGVGGEVVYYDGSSTKVRESVNVTLRGVVYFGSTTLVVGDAGTILTSTDEGESWVQRDSMVSDDLVAVARGTINEQNYIVAVAAEQVLVSINEGATWTVVASPAQGWGGLRAAFATHDELWVIGDGGSAWASSDPLGAWLVQDLQTTQDLIGGGRVSGDDDSTNASSIAVVSANSLHVRLADSDSWSPVVSVEFDGAIVAYGGGYLVTANGAVYDVAEDGLTTQVANVGLVPLAITGGLDGFAVAGEGANAARAYFQPCIGGRPWVVDGEIATAALTGDMPAGLTVDRRELSRVWARDALYEHASVASFCRASQDLMALGAPPELILATSRAIADELEHARSCFEIASRHAGVPLEAGALPMPRSFGSVSHSRARDPAAIAIAVLEEGCINESMAAAEAAVAAASCTDPQTRAALERIAADETRHAALAWRTLRWLLDHHGAEIAPALRERFARIGPPAIPAGPRARAHDGRLTAPERGAIHRRVFTDMIAPLFSQLVPGDGGHQPKLALS